MRERIKRSKSLEMQEVREMGRKKDGEEVGFPRGDRLEQVACQVADLALEMTEDALREASMYLRRCDSDRCATERALRRSRTADSASWDHQALGGTTKAAKGDKGLGSFD